MQLRTYQCGCDGRGLDGGVPDELGAEGGGGVGGRGGAEAGDDGGGAGTGRDGCVAPVSRGGRHCADGQCLVPSLYAQEIVRGARACGQTRAGCARRRAARHGRWIPATGRLIPRNATRETG